MAHIGRNSSLIWPAIKRSKGTLQLLARGATWRSPHDSAFTTRYGSSWLRRILQALIKRRVLAAQPIRQWRFGHLADEEEALVDQLVAHLPLKLSI